MNIEKAAQAHTDLTIFSAIRAILEGGTVYTRSGQKAAARIVAICGAEEQRQFKVYEREARP